MKLSPRFDEALRFASEIHRGQVRKGSGIPYIAHPMSVAALVLEYGGSEIEACAALLHDAAEDGGGEPVLAAIKRKFGPSVAKIVRQCSDSLLPKGVTKAPWRERKEAYLLEMRDASDSAKLVLAADKLHNARSILADIRRQGEEVWSRFAGGREGTLWYYQNVYRILLLDSAGTKRTELLRSLLAVNMELDIA